ncbi:hypothetical protein [Porphyromonas sp.]|uniref:hypothetical protein n=1 Tax=Porphyromonas sp. TaxID=1924944 RepID=UPI0026DB22BA|nr:hypothetical protein [Porphyromonas sp.]MDO4771759.1 hypothetical protein [Porphyromonas sp.]
MKKVVEAFMYALVTVMIGGGILYLWNGYVSPRLLLAVFIIIFVTYILWVLFRPKANKRK